MLTVANDRMDLFVPLLGRLLPLQINARTQQTTKIVYSTVDEVRAALIKRGLARGPGRAAENKEMFNNLRSKKDEIERAFGAVWTGSHWKNGMVVE